MFSRIKEWCFYIATLGPIGSWSGGGLVSSLVAIPLLMVARFISALHQDAAFLFCLGTIVSMVVIIHGALHFQSNKDASYLVLDRVLGFFIAFLGMSLTIKFFFAGFIIFHTVGIVRPLIFNKIGPLDLRSLPGVFGIITGDLIAGVAVNLFLRFVVWLAH